LAASFATLQSFKLPGQYFHFFLIIDPAFLQYALYVHFQIEFSSKLLATMIAFEGQNFEMLSFLVHSEVDLLGEAGWALVTFVRLFSRVDPHVVEELAHALLGVVASRVLALKQLEQPRLAQRFQKEIHLVVESIFGDFDIM